MTTTWRIVLAWAFAPGVLAVSSLLTGCDNDVETLPWLPNYTASGYGGKTSAGGKGGGANPGSAGQAGDAGESSAGGSLGEGGAGP